MRLRNITNFFRGLLIMAAVAVTGAHAARTWKVPAGVDTVRGILLEQNGYISLADPAWIEFAAQEQFGMIGGGGDIAPILDSELDMIANSTGHPEFRTAPICAHGGSRGGWWSMEVQDKVPLKVIAVNAGFHGIWRTSNPNIPTVMPINELDKTFYTPTGNTIEKDVGIAFVTNRAKGAQWSLPVIWGGTTHGMNGWMDLGMVLFSRAIHYRLPEGAKPRGGPVTLTNYPLDQGYLAHVYSAKKPFPTLYSWTDYPGDRDSASWFPDRYMAFVWRAFCTAKPAVAVMNPHPEYRNGKFDTGVPILDSQSVTLKGAVSNAAVTKVDYYNGDEFLGSATTSPYEVQACLPVGVSALIAIATDTSGARHSSVPVAVLVKRGAVACTPSKTGRAPHPRQGSIGQWRIQGTASGVSIHNPTRAEARVRILDPRGRTLVTSALPAGRDTRVALAGSSARGACVVTVEGHHGETAGRVVIGR